MRLYFSTLVLFAFSTGIVASSSIALANSEREIGRVDTIFDMDNISVDTTITGPAAKSIFDAVTATVRLENLPNYVRRAYGRSVDCYEHGSPVVDPSDWIYDCHLIVHEGGEIVMPPR